MSCTRRENPPRKCKKQSTVPATEETETHKALLIDVVLQNIFKFLGYKDLKSCRQVGNITWLRNSGKAWWSQSKVVIKGGGGQTDKTADYLNQTEITSSATNYKFDYFKDTKGPFWERLGPSIKYLEFDSSILKSVDEFRKLLYIQCPNLEKLIFKQFMFNLHATTNIVAPLNWQKPQFGEQRNLKSLKLVGTRIPVSWMELLSHVPNLQSIDTLVDNADILNAISIIRQHDAKMLKLSHIKIHISSRSDYENSIRSVFLDPNLSLETMVINAGHCQPETVVDILNLHAKSLKELYIQDSETDETVIKTLQQPLEILESLTIDDCVIPVEIFKYCPNVRRVHLFCGNISFPNILARGEPNLKISSCKVLALHINEASGDISNSTFQFFLDMFPNVETLDTAGLSNLNFSMICERLPKLTNFHVYASEIDAIGLLGYDPDSIPSGRIRNPNISNLKDLQSFSMISKLDSTRFEMNKFTGVEMKNGKEIFKELKGIRHLKKFELRNYELNRNDRIWKKMFAAYSGQ